MHNPCLAACGRGITGQYVSAGFYSLLMLVHAPEVFRAESLQESVWLTYKNWMWPGTLPCLSALGPPALPRRRGVIWPAWSISYSPSLGYELLWPCPHSSFQCYDSRHVWVIYTELVWELFATSPPLFFFLCFLSFEMGVVGKVFLVLELLVSCVFPALWVGKRGRWERLLAALFC